MSRVRYLREAEQVPGPGVLTHKMLGPDNGCSKGVTCGIAYFDAAEYAASNPVHDDQEGFVCIRGSGWAVVDGEEFRVEPECAWLVRPGQAHGLRRDPASAGPLVVCWFHAPA
jgi:mannose-6-phosphate isomerase-like protein (cupin superfamily)